MQHRHASSASRSRGRPSREDARRLTGLILGIARQRFLAVGFDRTTIDEIVQLAEISKQTFYSRFNDKREIFEEVVSVGVRDRLLSPMVPVAMPRGTSPSAALTAFGLRLFDAILQPDIVAFDRMLVAAAPSFPAAVQAVEDARQSLVALVADILGRARRDGEMEIPDLSQAAARFLDGAIAPRFRSASLGLTGLAITERDRDELERYVTFFVRGHAPSPPPRRARRSTDAPPTRHAGANLPPHY